MIFDLINSDYKVRLVTKNVLSVFSKNKSYTDKFISTLRNGTFKLNGSIKTSETIISYNTYNDNIYENVSNFIDRYTSNSKKVHEYISSFNLNHILWLRLKDLSTDEYNLLKLFLQLASDKPIIITNYIEKNKYKDKIYSLLLRVGLEDKIIIVPFSDVKEAVSVSTSQCYVKSKKDVKILSKFPNEFLNVEFKTHLNYYKNNNIKFYIKSNNNDITPNKYKYSLYEILNIIIYRLKMFIISCICWCLNIR